MIAIDTDRKDIVVTPDPARQVVELRLEGPDAAGSQVVRLSDQEARRLASLILYQASRLERSDNDWDQAPAVPARKSA